MRKTSFVLVLLLVLCLFSCGGDAEKEVTVTKIQDVASAPMTTEATNVTTPEIPDVFKVEPSVSKEISELPHSVADAVCMGGPIGGVPAFYVFESGLVYYVCGMSFDESGNETFLECRLSLPDCFEGGNITGIEGGGGSGEVFLYVTATKGDKTALLEYYFYCDSVTTPVSVVTLDVH